jgi:hypothetical protein
MAGDSAVLVQVGGRFAAVAGSVEIGNPIRREDPETVHAPWR